MAERIIERLIDDLDHTEIADGKGGSVEFAFRGTEYCIDLRDANIAKFEKALAPFIGAASTISVPRASASSTRRQRGTSGHEHTGAADTATIRAWATENGHPVNTRGRVPASVVSAYESANGR